MPPPQVSAAIVSEVATARAEISRLALMRWVDARQLHVTLAFLGDEVDLDEVSAKLAGFVVPAFDVSLRGLGAFPRPRAARVLWMGVCGGRSELSAASAALHARLGISAERRFTPHLTLARSRVPHDLGAVVRRDGQTIEWPIAEVVLFESTLGASGPTHRAHLRMVLS